MGERIGHFQHLIWFVYSLSSGSSLYLIKSLKVFKNRPAYMWFQLSLTKSMRTSLFHLLWSMKNRNPRVLYSFSVHTNTHAILLFLMGNGMLICEKTFLCMYLLQEFPQNQSKLYLLYASSVYIDFLILLTKFVKFVHRFDA